MSCTRNATGDPEPNLQHELTLAISRVHNCLALVVGYSELLSIDPHLAPRHHEMLEHMLQGVNDAVEILRGMQGTVRRLLEGD
jgi:hypothetical protein